MPFCTQCGHQNPEGSNFCARCGEPMVKANTSPTASAPEPSTDVDTQIHTFDATQVIEPVTDPELPLSSEEEAAIASLPAGSALLILNYGTDRGERFFIDGDTTTVGRHPKSDIFLDDITVSRHHAVFERTDDAVSVTDLGSLNGTYVNRTSIDSATPLTRGDEVMIGKFRLVYFASEHGLG